MFDEKTIQKLRYYVYMLTDPSGQQPFYIGKGQGNRVFEHMNCALAEPEITNARYDNIREIADKGMNVGHVIVRHGLTEEQAFLLESGLIDAFNHCGILLSNKVLGHDSISRGLMTTDEIIRLHNAKPLDSMDENCILININRKYQRGKESQSIYEATKETWTISRHRLPGIRYVLAEYRGLIVEVFEVQEWYPKERGYTPRSKRYGETKTGYGFNGRVAPFEIRDKYLNRSIAHAKKRGAAGVIRYRI